MSPPVRYPRPLQLAQLGRGHNVVEASAGTGKTFLLEHLFVDLVLSHGIPPEEILLVTFTEKATAELVLRLRRLLAALAAPSAGRATSVTAETLAWLVDERARQTLTKALLGFDRLSIFTMHAFCQRVLGEHAFLQGRLFDEDVVGSETSFGEAFAEALRTRFASDPRLAAIVAAWLERDKPIAELRGLLFACDAARASALRPELDEAALAAALAAWQPVAEDDRRLERLLREANLVRADTRADCLARLAAVSTAVAASAGDPLSFLTSAGAGAREHLSHVLAKTAGRSLAGELAAVVGRAQALHDAAISLQALAAQRLLPIVHERARAAKRAAGHFDFDDMLLLVDEALGDPGPGGRGLVSSLRRRYQHALIDEFQDTDEIQWSIFRRIFVAPGDHHGLTVIGDPKQAIYGFRGANVGTYREARQDLVARGAEQLELDENYRSTAELIAATNHIFAAGAGFFRPESGVVVGPPIRCGRPQRTLVSLAADPAAAVTVFDLETGAPSLRAGPARARVADAIVRELATLLDERCPLRLRDGEHQRRIRARDVFVLTFTHRDSSAIGCALAAARLPYAFYKQDKLFATAEAGEVLDVLRAVLAPEDRGLRARACLSRFFGFGLAEVAAAAAPESAATGLLLRLAALAEGADIPTLFSALVEETGVLRRELATGASERGLTNFMHVLELLQAEWARSHAGLPELADRLAGYVRETASPPGQEGDLQRLETDADAVQVLTVHKAKGLEADVVFLYGGLGRRTQESVRVLHEGSRRVAYVGRVDPAVEQRWREEQHDEHCRLLYVAATRARYRLYLPHYPPARCKLTGPYAPLNVRLGQILDRPPDRGFERRAISCDIPLPDQPPRPTVRSRPVDGGSLEAPAVPVEISEIRERRTGFLVSSYTAVKRARAGLAPPAETTRWASPDERTLPDPLPAESLPGGAATGIFLHELLAAVPLAELAAGPDFATWAALPEVTRLLERQRRRCGRPAEEVVPAARLVHAAYTTPVALGPTTLPNLACPKSVLREMEFLYPMPEPIHPLLHLPAGGPRAFPIARGVVKGFIDLLFEHAGRVYVCDWKSDVLPSYAPEDLAGHCHEHYDVQARLYTLAAIRLCRIADRAAFDQRFGGVLFCFLRGRAGDDARRGTCRLAPSWDEVVGWEREMLGAEFWGIRR